jgi:outer membrane lipoprotein-sorting protein
MREIQELSILTAKRCKIPFLLEFAGLLVILSVASGCGIKRTVKIEVPRKILQAKTASFSELIDIVGEYDKIRSVSGRLRLTFTSGKWESGKLDKYREAPGYILLRRPDDMHLVIQNPLTKTAELDLLSTGDDLRVWIPSKNEFYVGKNSAKELVAENLPNSPIIPIRTAPIFEAILTRSIGIDSPEIRVSLKDTADASAKYYELQTYKEGKTFRIYPVRNIWIERSALTISRQQIFLEDGQMASDIVYSNVISVDGFSLPLKIYLDRPLDGYTLNMEFKTWEVNKDLPDNAFVLTPPPGAQVVHLKEKDRE